MSNESNDKLYSRGFIAACVANFFYQFGRYFLVPIIALYLIDTWSANKTQVGLVLAGFSVSTMLIRPFCGFMADRLNRKRLYISSLAAFAVIFVGYPLANTIGAFAAVQIAHGLALGVLAVSANTLVIDITPSSRRGEGLGIYGIMNNIAMAFGPMTAIYIHTRWDYTAVFLTAFTSGLIAFIAGNFVPSRHRAITTPTSKFIISLDRFILIKGLPAGLNLLLLAVPYGMITSYIALYSEQLSLGRDTGVYFLCMGAGIMLSRLIGGKWVDRGHLTDVCSLGCVLASLSIILLTVAGFTTTITSLLFNSSALLSGLGYGLIFPAMNTLFVNLARHDQRGTASATYMTTWDVGIGLGMLFGGMLGDYIDFAYVFGISSLCNIASTIFFHTFTINHYERNRLE